MAIAPYAPRGHIWTMGNHNVYIPDELWKRIQRAAAEAGARKGEPVSISEWLREAAVEKIEREEG